MSNPSPPSSTATDGRPSGGTHTRGPWNVSLGRTLAHVAGADGHDICSVSTTPINKNITAVERNDYRARALNDARLIAAAPDYAAVVERALQWHDGESENDEWLRIVAAMRAVRTKAFPNG